MTRRAAITLALATLVALAALGVPPRFIEGGALIIDDAANEITFTDVHTGDAVVIASTLTNISHDTVDGLKGAIFVRAVPGDFGIQDATCEWYLASWEPCEPVWKPTQYPGYQVELIIGPGTLTLPPSASFNVLIRTTANVDHATVEMKALVFQDTGTVAHRYDARDTIVSDGDSPIRLGLSRQGQDAERTVNLSPGCNMATLTFADDTEVVALADAASPASALKTVWRLDNATGTFEAFVPQAPQASDLTSLDLLDAVFVCVDAAATITMPAVSPDPSGTPTSTDLATRCNTVGLTFPDDTDPSQVADAVTPPGALKTIWRLDNATGTFQAYVAAAPEASDLTSLQFLDAVFICTEEPAILDLPAITEPGPQAVTGPPTDIRFVMEAAVPQVVDLPHGFTAIDEEFDSYEPPGLLYYYDILYGTPLGYDAPSEAPRFISFDLALFDTVRSASSATERFASLSAEEWKADLEPRYGGSFGLEIGSLTIQELEPSAAIGDEVEWRRFRLQLRPVHSTGMFLPFPTDVIIIRRDRVLAWVWVDWAWGPPGPNFIPENLAKKMDAGIQEALPELLAAVP